MAALDEILAGYETLRPAQEAFYQDLHRHPELSHQEHRTAQRVADQLQNDGFAVVSAIGGTGVVGVLAKAAGPASCSAANSTRCRCARPPARPTRARTPPPTPAVTRCRSITPAATTCTWPP